METLHYKVAKSGKISAWRGKTRLSAIWLEEVAPQPARRDLRAQLDPRLVRAAWIIFGRRCLPGDLNALLAHKKVVLQVMADSPKLVAPIYHFVAAGTLKATPTHSLVRRFKSMLRQEGYTRRPAAPWLGSANTAPRKPETDMSLFWQYAWSGAEALTEAGWRYLLDLPYASVREHFCEAYQASRNLAWLNQFSVLNVQQLPAAVFSAVLNAGHYSRLTPEARKVLLLALREPDSVAVQTLGRQTDLVGDWLRAEEPTIHPGTRWQTLVDRAVTFALAQAELSRTELQDLRWTAPLKPYVTGEGLVVRPLETGAELLDEGHAMSNCLRDMRHYAHDAVQGKSLVFSIQGLAGRATVEFARKHLSRPWTLQQAEEASNRPVQVPALERAVRELEQKMKEAA